MITALIVWFISVFVTVAAFAIILLVLLLKTPSFKRKKNTKIEPIDEAARLISSAQAKAEEIIRDAKLFNEQASHQITKSLEEVSQKTKNKASKISENITSKASQELNDIINSHNEKWQQTLSKYEALTEQQLVLFRKTLTDSIKEEITNARQSVNQHRAKEEKRITQDLKKQMPEILKKLTGRSIPVDLHEDIVREALAKVRQDNILESI